MWIAIVGCLVGIYIPGIANYYAHTLYDTQIPDLLPDKARQQWADYQKELEETRTAIASIHDRVTTSSSSAPPAELASLIDTESELRSELKMLTNDPPIHVVGFLGPLMLIWPMFYICVGYLIFLFSPQVSRRMHPYRYLQVFSGVYILYRWPTWTRNLPQMQYVNRRVFSNGNWDISRLSFVVQEMQALLVCGMLVTLWMIWAKFLPLWQRHMARHWAALKSNGDIDDCWRDIGDLFIHWQICSVLLAGAFVPYTFFFWTYVVDDHDKRYLPHALIMHALWGLTWMLLSLPLAWTWYQWKFRYRKFEISLSSVSDDDDGKKKEMSSPISQWNVLGSLLGAIIAFLFPLLKELFAH